MAISPVDRDENYMYQMWGTKKLSTDYDSLEDKKIIQEIMHDEIPKNKFYISEEQHKKIRNDSDYDDWEYGSEPIYKSFWNES